MIILEYFKYPFVQYAMITGILIALCASLLGVPLVLKRFSFIGDGLSHVAFGAIAVAAAMGLSSDTVIVLPVTVLTAVFLLKTGQNSKIRGDARIAMISVGSLAVGYLLMHIFSTSANVSGDVCSSLFGSTAILTLSKTDVVICILMSVVVITMFVFFYNKIFSVTFDEAFAAATGINTSACNMATAVVTAIIIVLAMKLAGSLLVSALIIFPPLSAMRVNKSFKGVIITSAVISVVATFTGILISIAAEAPVGAMIVMVDIAVFAICSVIGKFC